MASSKWYKAWGDWVEDWIDWLYNRIEQVASWCSDWFDYLGSSVVEAMNRIVKLEKALDMKWYAGNKWDSGRLKAIEARLDNVELNIEWYVKQKVDEQINFRLWALEGELKNYVSEAIEPLQRDINKLKSDIANLQFWLPIEIQTQLKPYEDRLTQLEYEVANTEHRITQNLESYIDLKFNMLLGEVRANIEQWFESAVENLLNSQTELYSSAEQQAKDKAKEVIAEVKEIYGIYT